MAEHRPPATGATSLSPLVILGALVAILLLIVGAALYLPTGNPGDQRLGVLIALCSPVVLVLTNLVRTELAVKVSERTKVDTGELTNGLLTERLNTAIHAALMQHDRDVHGVQHAPNHPPILTESTTPRTFDPADPG